MTDKRFTVTMPVETLAAADHRAGTLGITRNAWINRALHFVLTQLPLDTNKLAPGVARTAPREVAGDRSYDLVKRV